jgi:hypothetical protein
LRVEKFNQCLCILKVFSIIFLHHSEIWCNSVNIAFSGEKESLVCKLNKDLYGLKQAPRQWYKEFDSFMCSTGFMKSFEKSYIVLLLYVDDMLVIGPSIWEINSLKKQFSK